MKESYIINNFEIFTDLRLQKSKKGRPFRVSGISSFDYRFVNKIYKSKTIIFYIFLDEEHLNGENQGFYIVLNYDYSFEKIIFFKNYSETI